MILKKYQEPGTNHPNQIVHIKTIIHVDFDDGLNNIKLIF